MQTTFEVVGHRGFPAQYPENSSRGLVAAAKLGAPWVELDVQLSKDKVPVVFHDIPLRRVCDVEGNLCDYTADELLEISCHEPRRFDDKFYPTPIESLAKVCQDLAPFQCGIFVEIKVECFAKLDRKRVLEKVMQAIKPVLSRVMIISFDDEILRLARPTTPIGWVLADYEPKQQEIALALEPNVLIIDVEKVTLEEPLWQGPWDWFLYDIVDRKRADKWFRHGVRYIETWDAASLLLRK